jgi:hypothetical protein
MWTVIAITFLVILAAFLLGVYLLIRKASKAVSKVPKQIVKEVFGIVKEKMSKPNPDKVK